MRRFGKGVLAAVAALAAFGWAGVAAPQPPAPFGWSGDPSEARPDPAAQYGALANGMRYVIRRNASPPGEVSMRLVILAGSMQESPAQAGLAHFLEHMAFHGSKSIPDGEMQRSLERLGLRMGGDLNANTAQTFTVYRFDLAKGDDATLDSSLLLLREIGGDLKLEAAAMDVERPVIAAEARSRSASDLAASQALLRAEIGEHPYARPTIGRQEVIASATANDLRAFYDAYYRPERAVLIVVGDIDPAQVEAKVKARFADWRGRGEAGGDPEPVSSPPKGAPASIIAIPGQRTSNLIIVHPRPYEPLRNGPGDLMRRELQGLAEGVYRQRMRDIAEADNKPFNATNGVREIRFPRVANLIVEEAVAINDPASATALMVAARDQVLQFGVTESELKRQVAARLGQLNTAISRATSLPTAGLANGLVQNVVSDAMPISPQDARAMVQDISRQITVGQINALLREELSQDGQLIFIGAEPPPGGEAALVQAIATGHARSLAAYAPPAIKPWPYTDFGPAGQVVERREVPDLNVTLVRFANGVRLAVRSSKGVKDQVFSSVRFGRGQLDFHKDRLTAEDYAAFMVNESELVGLSRQEKAASLSGRATAQTYQREDVFEMANMAGSHPSNLDIQMQLYAAAITQPVWRMDGWASRLSQTSQAEAAAQIDPGGVFAYQAPLLLHSGDMRWAVNDARTRAGWKRRRRPHPGRPAATGRGERAG
jgi:zinc protease